MFGRRGASAAKAMPGAANAANMPITPNILSNPRRLPGFLAMAHVKRGRTVSMGRAFWHAVAVFFKFFILKKGFLDGWPGFVIALGNFEGTFWRYAKATENGKGWDRAAYPES